MTDLEMGSPDGSEPSAAGPPETDCEPYARRKAAEMLMCAAHPSLVPAGGGFVTEDSPKADREAQIGLAWALVYLADALGGNKATAEEQA